MTGANPLQVHNIKQATPSRHVLDTEKRLGMALYDRKTRGATLAADGATYLRIAPGDAKV
ncbi:hypothetical protein NUH86_09705 [Sphingobium sp. JS3065]|uniref:helix-turn-helix domain-containing protein n=1 Tax=Sphingobium sp. JS3065 TaxID=2970925 RepID=UPI0022651484|nr:hypothetical protein [Sphingobium sp. JS3065]UZW53829.1 hypothetical protein NUH86_09705 [Sphingobium sp. JS3065]